MAEKPDVVVVGAGVFGAWTALQLRRTGRSVVLVDAFGTGNSRSSSSGASRVIRTGYGGQILYSRWAQRSAHAWHELLRDWRPNLFIRTGVLWMARQDDTTLAKTADTLGLLHTPYERLDRDTLEQRFPQFTFGPITHGLLEPGAGVINARRAVQTVVRQAVKQSVDYRIASVSPPHGTTRVDTLTTTDGDIVAGSYVFACGAWLPTLFPTLLGNRIHPTRQEVFFFGAKPGDRQFAPPLMPAWIDFAGGVYGLPDFEGRGFKIGLDHHGPPFDPDRGDRLASDDALQVARMILARRLPSLQDAPLLEARVCAYSNSWNGDFLIDRHPELENVWLVGGGSGHGFKHGPAVGEYVAGQLSGRDEPEPRFTLAQHEAHEQQARRVF
ncbi:MAG: FAD-dependent oxidoreductase [Acidobacteriota bacterium]|nr:FAD-dependent oxidoreductase [Acidobacteriota bacterium]